MPRTANTTTVTFQQKMKVLTKLYEGGCKTEKELQTLELAEMLKIPNITVQELSIIVELGHLILNVPAGALGGGDDEQSTQE